eukprot:SAG31_NODE_657_length_13108_cov_3.079330_15_plen_59_part_00
MMARAQSILRVALLLSAPPSPSALGPVLALAADVDGGAPAEQGVLSLYQASESEQAIK